MKKNPSQSLSSGIKVLVILLLVCYNHLMFAQENTNQQPAFPSGESFKNAGITYKIIPAADSTWGYDIYSDEQLIIHQPSVPAMHSNKGFITQERAAKVAELVINKIRKGEMPPSITPGEMRKIMQ